MPTVSAAQHRAMEAAAHGHSTLGIPKKVGEEYVAADANGELPDVRVTPKGGTVAGTVHVAPDGHVLLLRRAAHEKNFPGHWSLPGGNGDPGESAEEAADRENDEELGNTSPQGPKRLMDRRSTPTGKTFHTFAKPVDEKFWPRLNDEHNGAGWFGLNELPSPIHPAVKERLGADLGATEGMGDDAWTALHHNFAAWARGSDEQEQAQDEEMVIDLDDDENQLERLLLYIMENSKTGHSFDVVVDPDDPELAKKFYIDGDGAFRIRDVKTVGPKPRHAQDGACGSCHGAGNVHGEPCAACGGSGIASTISAPIKPGAGAMDADLIDLTCDGWSEGDHPRAENGEFGSGGTGGKSGTGAHGGSHQVFREKGDPRPKASEKEARMLAGKPPGKSGAEAATGHEHKRAISSEALSTKLKGMSVEKLQAALAHKDVDPKIKAHISREITSRHLAQDEVLAFDRAPAGLLIDRHGLAFDYAKPADSVRSESPDGHLHVEVSNISKAAVNPYRGDEIPGWKALGLTADKVYNLLRDPEELKKAAGTFDNLPLLDEHVPVNAKDHKPEHVIGSTGTDAEFDGDYLKNSLVVWADKGINAIKSEKKKELSSAYRYRADMTPGTHPRLGRYDGVMRDIVGNHVALVEDGRAGPDVVVGDSRNPLIPKEEKLVMTKKVLLSRMGTVAYGALMTHLQPKLAMDARLDLKRGLGNITAKNFKAKRPVLSAWLVESLKGKLDPKFAQDGSIKAGLDAVLDMIEGMPKAEDEFPDAKKDDEKPAEDESDVNEEEEDNEDEGAEDGDPDDEEKKKLEFSKDKKAKDKKPSAGARDKKARDEKPEDDKDKKAMDAAMVDKKVQAAVKSERELQQAIYAAKDHVRGRVGELGGMAFDSVEGVYIHAIKAAGKDTAPLEGVKPEALKFVFDNLPPLSGAGAPKHVYAYDGSGGSTPSSSEGIAKMNPGLAKNMQRIGSA